MSICVPGGTRVEVWPSKNRQLIPALMTIKQSQLKQLSNLCFVLGFASIIGSIAIWYMTGGTNDAAQAHGERFGIFVGLWAPTFFILSNRFDRYAGMPA